jgi:hypothetical protein
VLDLVVIDRPDFLGVGERGRPEGETARLGHGVDRTAQVRASRGAFRPVTALGIRTRAVESGQNRVVGRRTAPL